MEHWDSVYQIMHESTCDQVKDFFGGKQYLMVVSNKNSHNNRPSNQLLHERSCGKNLALLLQKT